MLFNRVLLSVFTPEHSIYLELEIIKNNTDCYCAVSCATWLLLFAICAKIISPLPMETWRLLLPAKSDRHVFISSSEKLGRYFGEQYHSYNKPLFPDHTTKTAVEVGQKPVAEINNGFNEHYYSKDRHWRIERTTAIRLERLSDRCNTRQVHVLCATPQFLQKIPHH